MKLLKLVLALGLSAGLAACNDGSTGAAGAAGASGAKGTNGLSALVSVVAEAPGANCPNGGSKISGGVDANANGVLDPTEVNSTQYVCNGATGSAGSGGLTTLVSVSAAASGASCPNGGKQVDIGLDSNANGVLDSTEVTSSSVVCNGVNGTNGVNGKNSLAAIAAEAAGANCAYGGSKVTSGLDGNGNGTLDSSEVTGVQYVCNGAPGAAGTNGQTSLVKQISLAVGNEQCPTGGIQVNSGVDTNGNDILDVAEVTDTQYVCNGATGTTGAAGNNGLNSLVSLTSLSVGNATCPNGGTEAQSGLDANGDNLLEAGETTSTSFVCNGAAGAAGSTGATGASGLKSLIAMATEAAGANCTYGGTKVTSGVDSNGDGVLQAGEVTATSYTCNGPPGPGITWIDVTATSVQAQSNKGYLADNTALVTITLPTAPVLGDVIGITGVGAGGWKIAQNAGQFIKTTGLPGSPSVGAFLATGAPQQNWWSAASSADGSHIVAALNGATNGFGTRIYGSTDFGASWNSIGAGGPQGQFSQAYVASSADGSHLIDAVSGSPIYTSSNYGATWTTNVGNMAWIGVASSSDGTHLVATVNNGPIYVTTNSGTAWTSVASTQTWRGVASSSDGTHLAAVVFGGQIWTSSDSGANWTAHATAQNWTAIASSADGTHLAATVSGGQIYTSPDSGVTWTAQASTSQSWASITSSADGTHLAAVFQGGQIYTSIDSGVTWIPSGTALNYNTVTSSADGGHLYAAVYNGLIYASSSNQTTAGTSGSLSGSQDDAIELQYVGSNTFIVLDSTSNSGSFTVQ